MSRIGRIRIIYVWRLLSTIATFEGRFPIRGANRHLCITLSILWAVILRSALLYDIKGTMCGTQ